MVLISVHDKIADTWTPPSPQYNVDSAKRMFAQACNDPRSQLGQSPADYELFAVGEWLESFEPGKRPEFRRFDDFLFLAVGSRGNSDGQNA